MVLHFLLMSCLLSLLGKDDNSIEIKTDKELDRESTMKATNLFGYVSNSSWSILSTMQKTAFQTCKEKTQRANKNSKFRLKIAHGMFGFYILWILKNLQFSSYAFEVRSYCRSNVNKMHYNLFSCFSAHSIVHCLFLSTLKSYFYRNSDQSWIHTNAKWLSLTIFQKLLRW